MLCLKLLPQISSHLNEPFLLYIIYIWVEVHAKRFQSYGPFLKFLYIHIACDKAGIYILLTLSFFVFCFFSVRLLSVLRGHSVFSSPPQRPMTSDFEAFSIPDFIHYIYFPILILEKESVFSLLNVRC